ncbi:hypothetical protein QYE76_035511 [Lolium multiflorum]|uniref:Uncharacterized protein n=1 Tax=Lolium multiflorum TaxID=4521 RepID=A0AAD8VPA0_LOLMU|nr:hypothetical protein QYE76_035511 [Lolium multiflorum]
MPETLAISLPPPLLSGLDPGQLRRPDPDPSAYPDAQPCPTGSPSSSPPPLSPSSLLRLPPPASRARRFASGALESGGARCVIAASSRRCGEALIGWAARARWVASPASNPGPTTSAATPSTVSPSDTDDASDSSGSPSPRRSRSRHHRRSRRKATPSSSSDASDSQASGSGSDSGGRRRKRSSSGKRGGITEEQIVEYMSKKAQKKAEKVAKKMKGNAVSGYSDDSNPFGDPNLTENFVWRKKIERAVTEGQTVDISVKTEKKKMRDRMAEIEKVKKRREERAIEKAQHEEEMALLARERARAEFQDWEKKEEEVHTSQPDN